MDAMGRAQGLEITIMTSSRMGRKLSSLWRGRLEGEPLAKLSVSVPKWFWALLEGDSGTKKPLSRD
jgi:hypothetical protein